MSENRYLRHNLIDWFSQERLARTRAVVIGAGAVGNEVLKNLALLGVGEVRVYDFDRIEEHNLTRSVLFRDADIGKQKAEVAADRARELDPNMSAEAVVGDFWDHLTLSDLKSFDVLFCCVDNFEARIRSNMLCQIARVDFINVGIDSRFALVEQYPFTRNHTGGCFECGLPPSVYRRISERYSCGHLRKLSYIERKVPTTIITSSTASSLAVSVGLRLGTGDEVPSARRFYVDTIAGNLTRTELGRVGGCPCCDRYAGELSIIGCRPIIGDWPISGDDVTVFTSDPILVSYRIGEISMPVFERASAFSSDYPTTLSPDPGAVDLEIRDQFSATELADRFANYTIPSKFALVSNGAKSTIFEFLREPQ
ncbi:HesA/MoeB/ThiF family protein [Mesorhizobium sp. BR1-1-2]|uniref:HesA/MoeB/ThiF family protein n=1 Tax=Mesorhizobium sp. BR1-1-2 TaxID=2876652 RepID=UPI001CC9D459|nr:ThiF family adenylyltransferase [Mesorhizobium sp. BR1-1-2]MBZ9963735.1 ThiF family adenylyltransferase [Mesorhizobium sp. BR1-1-2]